MTILREKLSLLLIAKGFAHNERADLDLVLAKVDYDISIDPSK